MFFHRFAVHVLRSYMFSREQAAILSYAGLHQRATTGYLPSWAPDWMSMSTAGPAVFGTIAKSHISVLKKQYLCYNSMEMVMRPKADT
jgi:hypothetical protein